MPITIIFVGFVFFLIIDRLENGTSEKFVVPKKKLPWIKIFALVFFVALMFMEWYLYITGEIYKSGIWIIDFVKLFLLFLAGSVALFVKQKKLEKTLKYKIVALLPTYGLIFVIILVIFLN